MKKFILICLMPFSLLASDEQLDEIINLLKYQYFVSDPDADPWDPGTEYNYTMSDFLRLNKKASPFVEEYFLGSDGGRGASYSNFMDFLFSKGISDFYDFLSIPSDEQQKLYFEFYQQEVSNLFTTDLYDYYNSGGTQGFFNPLLMANMALSKLAFSGGSSSSSGGSGDSGTDSQGRNLLQVIESIDNNISSIDSSLYYTKVNSKNMPILDTSSFASWMFSSVDNASLYSTNKPLAFVTALKSIFDYRLNNFGNDYIGEITPDFLAGYLDVLNAQDRLNGGGGGGGGVAGGGFDDPSFKRSVTNSLTNISTNSNTVVDILKKILEQISKMQTNQSSIADSVYWMTNNFPDEVGGVLPPGSGVGGSNDVWHAWDVFANNISGNSIKVPSIVWDEITVDGERVLFPRYDDPKFQPSEKYDSFWRQYQELLDNARVGSINGQEFLTGVEIFSMRFLADISSQMMILNSHMPSTTNLWDDIKDLVENKIPQEITALENQINGERSKIESLNRVDSVSRFVQPITKVKTAISKLKPSSNDRVIRIPLPSVLSISGGDWVIDLEEINGYPSLRQTIRFICALIYTFLFIRTLIVPCMILICLGVRLMDTSLGLLFFDDTTAVKILGEWTANAFDIFCHLIGLDTDFKKWAVGIYT